MYWKFDQLLQNWASNGEQCKVVIVPVDTGMMENQKIFNFVVIPSAAIPSISNLQKNWCSNSSPLSNSLGIRTPNSRKYGNLHMSQHKLDCSRVSMNWKLCRKCWCSDRNLTREQKWNHVSHNINIKWMKLMLIRALKVPLRFLWSGSYYNFLSCKNFPMLQAEQLHWVYALWIVRILIHKKISKDI